MASSKKTKKTAESETVVSAAPTIGFPLQTEEQVIASGGVRAVMYGRRTDTGAVFVVAEGAHQDFPFEVISHSTYVAEQNRARAAATAAIDAGLAQRAEAKRLAREQIADKLGIPVEDLLAALDVGE